MFGFFGGGKKEDVVESAEKVPTSIGYEIRGGKLVWWLKFDDGSEGEKQVEEDFPLAKTTVENEQNIRDFEQKKIEEYHLIEEVTE
jgi:hypothetical protein